MASPLRYLVNDLYFFDSSWLIRVGVGHLLPGETCISDPEKFGRLVSNLIDKTNDRNLKINVSNNWLF